MLLRIFLVSSAFVVASANNAIPAQIYPIYQQNGYMNPQANQPNNIQPYLQGVTTQNQLQQLNISPYSIKQALLNRLLNGQSMQAISDSNARSYSTNLNGVQNNPISENVGNNNYVTVAKDYLNNNTSNANIGTKSNDSSPKKRKQSNKRRSKTRRQKNAEKIESSTNKNKPAILSNTKNIENFTENNKPSRKNINNNNSQATEPEKGTNKSDNGNNKRTRRRKKKKQDQTTQNPIIEENKVENTKPKRRRKKQKSNVNSESDNQVVIKSKSKEIENVDLDITNEGMNNEKRLTRNPKKDANEPKLSRNAPKEIQNPFLSNKNQFNNPLMGNWFANFENIYQSLVTQPPVSNIRPKRRKKSKRNRKPKRKMVQNKNVTAEAIVVKPITGDIDTTTTASIVLINEKVETNLNSNPTEESPKSFEPGDLSSNEIFRDGYNINEFEGKYDPGFYGGYIDDYYPQFTDSAAYNANNKEIILKNLNDNKYYYATDIIETDFTKNIYKLNHELPERDIMEYKKNKHTYDDIEKESIRNAYKKEFDELEQLQFRSPPLLESPDFRTRQIERSEIRPEVYYVYDNSYDKLLEDKSSNYSPAKIPYSSGAKQNGIKIQPKYVETVFAKSKVASYGPVYTPGEDSSSATTNQISWSDHSFSNDSFKIGDTTYVVAKSLDYPEPYW